MTTRATQRAVRNILRRTKPPEKFNILTACAHERYEQQLCKTGHNFYCVNIGKTWDTDYGDVPDNYHIINDIPEYLDFDLILTHTSCDRIIRIHDFLCQVEGLGLNHTHIPILRHCHVLPDIRYDVFEQVKSFSSLNADHNSFISNFNRQQWGYSEHSENTHVIEHGIDVDFWKSAPQPRENVCLSVVNDWPNRDWCCGFKLWQQTINGLPYKVYGKSPGFSEPAQSIEHLRQIYSSSRIFYNTSLHSPIPTVMLEAMASGCAVVSTANCMIPSIIENGVNGFISNDPNELRSYLQMLLNNEPLATEMGQRAQKTIEERFHLDKFVASWDNLFHTVIKDYRG